MAIALYALYRMEDGKPVFLDWYGTPQLAHEKGIEVYGGNFKVWPFSVNEKATMHDADLKALREVNKLAE